MVRSFKLLISVAVILLQPFISLTKVFAAPEYADVPFTSNAATHEWISNDGNYIGISSHSSLNGDSLGAGHFIRDRDSNTTIRVLTFDPSQVSIKGMSDDLRFALVLSSIDLVPQDTNGKYDVYVLDRQTQAFELISVSITGVSGNDFSLPEELGVSISGDGRFVVFMSKSTNLTSGSDDNGELDVFIRDRLLNSTIRISSDNQGNAANGNSPQIVISDDGTTVAFTSEAPSLTGLNSSSREVIIQNLQSGARHIASAPQGVPQSTNFCRSPSLSNSGRYVAFTCGVVIESTAPNTENAYRYDNTNGELLYINREPATNSVNTAFINGDGSRIIYNDFSLRTLSWDAMNNSVSLIASNTRVTALSSNGLVMVAQELSPLRVGVWTLPPIVNDIVPPVVQGSVNIPANSIGWHKNVPTISWTVSDPSPSSGNPTIPSPIIANLEGIHAYTSEQSCDPAGNCATGSYQVKLDTVLPAGTFTGNAVVIRFLGQGIAGTATDATSGVDKVEVVSGTVTLSSNSGSITLACNTGTTSCTWNANPISLPSGNQTLTLRVTDKAGNVFVTTKNYIII